ncbi:NUDIX domain-containing protein [Aquicoccus sp.]|uniref:NUDIX domain-containing protein n=1 Tax=Aquicoccus sp. TaxID=2055851 RepID=UPI003566AFD7
MSDGFHVVGPLPDPVRWRVAAVLARDRQGRVLMQLRDAVPGIVAPGKWSLFGGGIEPGETPEAAARREFHEETGIDISADGLQPLVMFASQARADAVVHVFALDRRIGTQDISLAEGAGFGFLNRRQVVQFDLIDNYRRTLLELDDF